MVAAVTISNKLLNAVFNIPVILLLNLFNSQENLINIYRRMQSISVQFDPYYPVFVLRYARMAEWSGCITRASGFSFHMRHIFHVRILTVVSFLATVLFGKFAMRLGQKKEDSWRTKISKCS